MSAFKAFEMTTHSTLVLACRRWLLTAAQASVLVLGGIGLALPALAVYPDKPIRLVVPFAPGGGTDLVGRLVAEGMAQDLGQPMIVDNKPGAGTIIGTDFVAKSAPDGYTLVMGTFALAANPALVAKLPFDPNKDLAPVGLIGTSPNVLVVRTDKPWKSVNDVLSAAKAAPGKLNYGSFGNGTSAHLAGALFANLAKVELTHIPYKGSSPALTDLLGGQIDMMFTTVASVAQYINSGKLRALAVTSGKRSPAWPDLPTLAEAGLVGYMAESWYSVYAPAGTPAAVVARLNAALKQAVKSENFRSRVEAEGLVSNVGTPAELERYVMAEQLRWRRVVQDARIKAD